jgi:hypothetical protein
VAWIWWYDRQGAVQSGGIDFVQDLPRFLVLLFALQRFELKDWGIICDLDCAALRAHGYYDGNEDTLTINYPEDNVSVTVNPDRPLFSRYSLVGRGTRVLDVENARTPKDTKVLDKKLIIKLSWIEETRTPEPVLVAKVLEKGKNDPYVINHMPCILAWKDHEYSTATIRKLFKAKTPTGEPVIAGRVLRSMVSGKLYKMKTLVRAHFLTAFFGIVNCMYA